jgi:DNA-binding NtrC family response regulator
MSDRHRERSRIAYSRHFWGGAILAMSKFMTPTGNRVLVVDDDSDWRQIVADVLSESGYEVIAAEDGLDGWEKMLEAEPLVVVTDLQMPRMPGQQLLLNVRNKDKRVPVIIITAERVERASPLWRDAFRVLSKPVNVDDMVHAVRDAADHRRERLPLNLLWRAARTARPVRGTNRAMMMWRAFWRWAGSTESSPRPLHLALGALVLGLSTVLVLRTSA